MLQRIHELIIELAEYERAPNAVTNTVVRDTHKHREYKRRTANMRDEVTIMR